ncbi:hypothetical protein XENORESO_017424 [Xenotaenia resolanae]|uniref:CD3 gamma/delta subunit Ig-like domain-containing protein n=1 Tax=Xenotaenia resolanae TaxID=208358 RepID=A0ABV0VXA1_9TELE
MKYQLLVLWILTAFSVNHAADKIQVAETADGIKLSCSENLSYGEKHLGVTEVDLPYRDSNTGEYSCGDDAKIFVKFRTCDNCVELDTSSIVGLAVGDVVATIVVGVAVYLIASQARTGQVKPTKKSKSLSVCLLFSLCCTTQTLKYDLRWSNFFSSNFCVF